MLNNERRHNLGGSTRKYFGWCLEALKLASAGIVCADNSQGCRHLVCGGGSWPGGFSSLHPTHVLVIQNSAEFFTSLYKRL